MRRNLKVALVLYVIAIVLSFTINTPKKNYFTGMDKYYGWYKVQSGDTLTSIHDEFDSARPLNEFIQEVKNINHLNGDRIISGRHIVVPYGVIKSSAGAGRVLK